MPKNKGIALVPILIVVALVATLSATGFFLWQNQQLSSRTGQITSLPALTATPTPFVVQDEVSNWKTLVFLKYNFTMKIPPEGWVISNDAMNGTPFV